MKHPERKDWPEWLREADTVEPDVTMYRGVVIWNGGQFLGGEFRGVRARALRCFYGLYRYQCAALLDAHGKPWVQMGCLLKSLEDWERVGIRQSNPVEFPDDGSARSEERADAFLFAKSVALRLAASDGKPARSA